MPTLSAAAREEMLADLEQSGQNSGSYLLVRRQAVETACACQLWVPQERPSADKTGAQRQGSGPSSVVKSSQANGTGH